MWRPTTVSTKQLKHRARLRSSSRQITVRAGWSEVLCFQGKSSGFSAARAPVRFQNVMRFQNENWPPNVGLQSELCCRCSARAPGHVGIVHRHNAKLGRKAQRGRLGEQCLMVCIRTPKGGSRRSRRALAGHMLRTLVHYRALPNWSATPRCGSCDDVCGHRGRRQHEGCDNARSTTKDSSGFRIATPANRHPRPSVDAFVEACIRVKTSGIRSTPTPASSPSVANDEQPAREPLNHDPSRSMYRA
jgi:hypothetical protein